MSKNSNAIAAHKSSAEHQDSLWVKWPSVMLWPDPLDLYEAAAYKRVSPSTIRRLCHPDRKGKAALKHQRIGASYRISKRALDSFGVVKDRTEEVAA